jgi:hypothetical protein
MKVIHIRASKNLSDDFYLRLLGANKWQHALPNYDPSNKNAADGAGG